MLIKYDYKISGCVFLFGTRFSSISRKNSSCFKRSYDLIAGKHICFSGTVIALVIKGIMLNAS